MKTDQNSYAVFDFTFHCLLLIVKLRRYISTQKQCCIGVAFVQSVRTGKDRAPAEIFTAFYTLSLPRHTDGQTDKTTITRVVYRNCFGDSVHVYKLTLDQKEKARDECYILKNKFSMKGMLQRLRVCLFFHLVFLSSQLVYSEVHCRVSRYIYNNRYVQDYLHCFGFIVSFLFALSRLLLRRKCAHQFQCKCRL